MINSRVVAIALMVWLGACDRTSEESLFSVPEEYQGRWSINPETCDRDTLATQDWLYVYDDVIGSHDHLYLFASLQISDNKFEYTTEKGGPSGSLTLLDNGNLMSEAVGNEWSLCSKVPEL